MSRSRRLARNGAIPFLWARQGSTLKELEAKHLLHPAAHPLFPRAGESVESVLAQSSRRRQGVALVVCLAQGTAFLPALDGWALQASGASVEPLVARFVNAVGCIGGFLSLPRIS